MCLCILSLLFSLLFISFQIHIIIFLRKKTKKLLVTAEKILAPSREKYNKNKNNFFSLLHRYIIPLLILSLSPLQPPLPLFLSPVRPQSATVVVIKILKLILIRQIELAFPPLFILYGRNALLKITNIKNQKV